MDTKHPGWVFERSSGYAGYRNTQTGEWVYSLDNIMTSQQVIACLTLNKVPHRDIGGVVEMQVNGVWMVAPHGRPALYDKMGYGDKP